MESRIFIAFRLHVPISLFLLFFVPLCFGEDRCDDPVARLVSLQGSAEIQREGTESWNALGGIVAFCPGDVLRVDADSRAAVVLSNETILRIGQKSTVAFPRMVPQRQTVLDLLQGILHIFTHRPQSFKVVTPYVNGVVEGTEFLVSADSNQSAITVYEGSVSARNDLGAILLAANQSGVARAGEAPRKTGLVKSRDGVHWTLYYPAIFGGKSSGKSHREGQLTRRAEVHLTYGQVKEAKALLATILDKNPQDSDANALMSIVETVQNNNDAGMEYARKAWREAPRSAAAGLALSYALQARFELAEAVNILEQSAEQNPSDALVNARLAELYTGAGYHADALAAANRAIDVNPEIGLTQAVLGFVHLSRVEIKEALAAFTRGAELDPVLPLARLGLGLAQIRMGSLGDGRANIEIAAALDPTNALIRSYLGKAYFEERRDLHAQRQYEIAKQLDSADPTPWFYDALRKQSSNRPVEALYDIQQSIRRNDNRAVYRSRLYLDEDLAARSAGLGRIYRDLGFEQLARKEAMKSVNTDPGNYSAHRFLADIYSGLPRHEIARVSELLLAQLLQPLNVNPVQPQLAESELAVVEGLGPASTSFNEFNPLFLRDRITLQGSGVVGSNGIAGDELVLSGVAGKFSYSLGQYHYETDGVRKNNDEEKDIYNGFFQAMLSPETSVMTEFRFRERDFGDLSLKFERDDFDPGIRQGEEIKDARIGIRHDLSPGSTFLATAIVGNGDGNVERNMGFFSIADIEADRDNAMAEVQYNYNSTVFRLQSGAGFLDIEKSRRIMFYFPVMREIKSKQDEEHFNIYTYGQIDLPGNIVATIGLSGDFLESDVNDENQINPKIGLTWQPTDRTQINLAAFQTLTRNVINSQTIEPTFVSGFNQFYDDFPGAVAKNYGIGLDHSFSENWHGGVRFLHRNLDVPFESPTPAGIVLLEDEWDEDIGSAYLYWVACNWLTTGLEYFYEDYSQEMFGGPRGIAELTTHRVVPQVHFHHPSGFGVQAEAQYIHQEGEFESSFMEFTEGSDDFWLVDLAVSYRLPKRYGEVKLEIKNLFDEQFSYLDTDPANPRFLPEQQIVGSVTLAF